MSRTTNPQLEFPFMSDTALSLNASFILDNLLSPAINPETALTRAEILTQYQATDAEIQPGTVKSAINELKTAGHIQESTRKTGKKGKPPAVFFRTMPQNEVA